MGTETSPLMRLHIVTAAVLAVSLAALSCIDDPPTYPSATEHQAYVRLVWELYDEKYVGFDGKDIDWDRTGEQFVELAADVDSYDELRELIISMVGQLEDRNAWFREGGDATPTWLPPGMVPNCDESVLFDLLGPWGFEWDSSAGLMWGACVIDTIPYFAIRHFNYFFTYQAFRNEFIEHLDAPGMIVDVRLADDVSLVPANQLPNLFVDQPMTVFLTQHRTGPSHDDLSPLEAHTVSPSAWTYNGPVVLLVGRQNIGPAEAFASAMSRLPHVTVIGDTTGGGGNTPGFMSQRYWSLWGSCSITAPFARVLNADSSSIEDAGIVPHIYVPATPEDFAAGSDPVLEYALEWIGAESAR